MDDDIFYLGSSENKPDEPKKQEELLKHVKYLTEKFPRGFMIITVPDEGTVCQMYKWNPKMYVILNQVEVFIKKISGWSVGGLN